MWVLKNLSNPGKDADIMVTSLSPGMQRIRRHAGPHVSHCCCRWPQTQWMVVNMAQQPGTTGSSGSAGAGGGGGGGGGPVSLPGATGLGPLGPLSLPLPFTTSAAAAAAAAAATGLPLPQAAQLLAAAPGLGLNLNNLSTVSNLNNNNNGNPGMGTSHSAGGPMATAVAAAAAAATGSHVAMPEASKIGRGVVGGAFGGGLLGGLVGAERCDHAERDEALTRYRQKRKTRHFEKTIRYASRQVGAWACCSAMPARCLRCTAAVG